MYNDSSNSFGRRRINEFQTSLHDILRRDFIIVIHQLIFAFSGFLDTVYITVITLSHTRKILLFISVLGIIDSLIVCVYVCLNVCLYLSIERDTSRVCVESNNTLRPYARDRLIIFSYLIGG